MNDYMNDLNEPVQNSNEPPQGTEGYTEGGYPTDSAAYRRKSYIPDEYSVLKPKKAADGYEFSYGEFEIDADRSILMEYVKVALGAIVGAVPGLLIWMLLGRSAVIAAVCGFLLAGGVVAGYTFMSKDVSPIDEKIGVIICLAVIIIAVYLGEKSVWASSMSTAFRTIVPKAQNIMNEFTDAFGLTSEDVAGLIGEEAVPYTKELGFNGKSFWGCFFNFGKALDFFTAKKDFCKSLLWSYVFAGVGGGSIFYKFAKGR